MKGMLADRCRDVISESGIVVIIVIRTAIIIKAPPRTQFGTCIGACCKCRGTYYHGNGTTCA